MNNYACLFSFLIGTFNILHAEAPLEHIDKIQCPTQNELSSYTPERISQNKLKYWFGGKYFQWTPMSVEVDAAPPFTSSKTPELQPINIELIQDATNGEWVIKCRFLVDGTSSDIASTLTIKAKKCSLSGVTQSVSCKN